MTRAVLAVRRATGLPVGVNVLRNDVRAALAIAQVCKAQFVRANVWVGAAVTDQGVIEGAAREAILYRREIGADVAIWADIFVKHSVQLGGGEIADAARDAVLRGRADALIVTGSATGSAASEADLASVRSAVPDTPILIGSGFSADRGVGGLAFANGAIVGTSLKVDGIVENAIDPNRVRVIRSAMIGEQ